MDKEKWTTRRVDRLERLKNSVNGNPRYRVHFTDGSSAVTQSDAAFCYGIDNPDMRGDVQVKFTRAGKIEQMRPKPVE